MKKEDFKNKTDSELLSVLKEMRDKVSSIRFSRSTGKVKNVKEASVTKKNVARVLTALSLRKKAEVKTKK